MFKEIKSLDELLRYVKALDQDEGILIENEEKINITRYSFNYVIILRKKTETKYKIFESVEDLRKFFENRLKFPINISFY